MNAVGDTKMEKRCFVPNCECTNGVNFPKDNDLRKIWLDGLNLKDTVPNDDDFICLGHFDSKDLNDEYVPGNMAVIVRLCVG